MKKIFLISLLYVFSINSVVFANNSYDFCEEKKEVKLNFKLNYGNIKYNHDLSSDEISNMYSSNRSQFSSFHGYTTKGLTYTKYKKRYNVKIQKVIKDNKACIYPYEIDVYLGYPDMVIYIDKTYGKTSCEYKAILEHENKHVSIYQKNLKKYGMKIGKEMYDIVQELYPVEVQNPAEINEVSDNIINDIIHKLKTDDIIVSLENNMESEIELQNKSLDSKESYGFTKGKCSSW